MPPGGGFSISQSTSDARKLGGIMAGSIGARVASSGASEAEAAKRKGCPKASFTISSVSQAAINAGFDFRRYAMKPTPAKPRSIIAQVVGSGTAAVATKPRSNPVAAST